MLRTTRRGLTWLASTRTTAPQGDGVTVASDELETQLSEVPRDKWGHPILPIPENISRKDYESELLGAADRAGEDAVVGACETNERVLVAVRRPRHGGQGRHDPTHARAPQPALRARTSRCRRPPTSNAGQWYFQRYVEQLPTHGEIAFFDRSWYNRAGSNA